MTRARSLSRLANSTVFTVSDTNRVGIGSTQPDVKLDVGGDMNVQGTLTYEDVTNVETTGIITCSQLVVTGVGATIGGITTFFGDINFGAAGVGGTVTTLGHAEFVGVVTASSFSGDGSGLTGVASTDNINTSTLAQFTGGVGIADSIFHIGDSNNAIRFPAADTFTVTTGGGERLRVDSSGRVLIGKNTAPVGTDAQYAKFAVRGNTLNTNAAYLSLGNGKSTADTGNDDNLGIIVFNDDDSSDAGEYARIIGATDGANGTNDYPGKLIFLTTADGASSPTERLRITSSGRVVVGDDTERNNYDNGSVTSNLLHVERTAASGNAGISICANAGTAADVGAILYMGRTSATSNGGNTIVESGDLIGRISFQGADGSQLVEAASIKVDVDGTPGADDMPGRMEFHTTADGGSGSVERARIDSSGRFYVGGTVNVAHPNMDDIIVGDATGNRGITVASATNGFGTLAFGDSTDGSGNDRYQGFVEYYHSDNSMRLGTVASERLRIDSSGNIIIKNSTSGGLYLKGINGDGDEKILIGYESGTIVRIAESLRMDFGTTSLEPVTDNSVDLGQADKRWKNIYSADLQLSNEGSSNDVDGTWGKYTIQEGENDLFLLNRRNGKTYKFVLEEVD